MAHIINQDAEQLLDKFIPVLDHGKVVLIDYMGGDERIVNAARTSYGEGTRTVRENQGLINYLMRNQHTSPFEMVRFTFFIKLPIFVCRQLIRHRTASVNEYSGRYSVMTDEFYIPDYEAIKGQDNHNRQGSEGELPAATRGWVQHQLRHDQHALYETYEEYLEEGVARETARINLPVSNYTQLYWTIDLHNLFHFLKLRLDEHAQYEIRVYADTIARIVKAACPMAWAAFEEHNLYTKTLPRGAWTAIRSVLETQDMIETIEKEFKVDLSEPCPHNV